MAEHPQPSYTLAWINHLAEVSPTEWDAMAIPLKTPFLEWEWLNNMETSGSTTARSGWQPNHLVVWKEVPHQGRRLVAAAPLYLKGHSYGEFVFDHQWADLAQRLGIQYYPKLLGMSPFTPAVGYRFLIAPDEDEEQLTQWMVAAIDHFCDRHGISGCHFLYVDPTWQTTMERLGFLAWAHHSYVWQNQNFRTFDDYLAMFNANQRRNIKRERKAVQTAGLQLKILTGEEIPKSHLSKMYQFYAHTCDQFGWWGSKYLTRKFFEQLYPNYTHRVVLVAAYDENRNAEPVGMSICLVKGPQLYGRYWGSFQAVDCLHFDACYYSPIEWAIAQGIQTFDPGAGGHHKKRRGFPATLNFSLHRLYHDRLAHILSSHIQEINELEKREIDAVNQELPFKVVT